MYKLLIVEDEMIIRKGIIGGFAWNDMGFEIIGEAANGKSALKLLEGLAPDSLPDIVLLDIQMPGMNGIQLMEQLESTYPSIKTVILSGFNDFSYAQQAIALGALGYLLKPTKKTDIEKTFLRVRRILDERQEEPKDLPKHVKDPVIDKIKRYVEQNYNQKVTLETVAELAYMNPSYISTYFKQKTGISFKNYITELRIEKAKKLLQETSLKTYDISGLIGYEDYRYFCKLFKSVTGMTTVGFRKSVNNEVSDEE